LSARPKGAGGQSLDEIKTCIRSKCDHSSPVVQRGREAVLNRNSAAFLKPLRPFLEYIDNAAAVESHKVGRAQTARGALLLAILPNACRGGREHSNSHLIVCGIPITPARGMKCFVAERDSVKIAHNRTGLFYAARLAR
jgi:hypothetical protein